MYHMPNVSSSKCELSVDSVGIITSAKNMHAISNCHVQVNTVSHKDRNPLGELVGN